MRTTPTIGILGWILVAASVAVHADDNIPWARDLRTAQETAAKEKRLVLLHFWAPNCPPCQAVERYVFPHPEVGRAIRANYVPLSVNAQALPELAKKYGVDRWPTDVILSSEGEVLSRAVSPKEANQYLALVNRVASTRGADQSNWGTLAQNLRPQPPTYQANQFQSRDARPNPFAGTPGANAQSGEYQATPPNYQAGRPVETTTGFAQYGPAAGGENPKGAAANPYLSGKGATSYTGNPYVEVGANRAAPPPADKFAAGQYDPRSNSAPADLNQKWVSNSEFHPSTLRERNPSALGGRLGESRSSGSEFPGGGEFGAQEGPENYGNALARGGARSAMPAYRGLDYRQVASESAVDAPAQTFDKPLALEGFCPVTLVESKRVWKRGSAEFGAIHRGRTYLFCGPREQAAFLADPDRFSPVLSCYDPVRFLDNQQLVEGKRQFGVFMGDQIYLFADAQSRERFEAAAQSYVGLVHEAMLRNEVGNRRR